MKYIFAIFLALTLATCKYLNNYIEFNGKTPGMTGNVIIKDGNAIVFGATIANGAFHINKQLLAKIGYYQLYFPGVDEPFEIYLEPGNYAIQPRKKGIVNYPIITSSSKLQNELSNYYVLADSIKYTSHTEMNSLLAEFNSQKSQALSKDKYKELLDNLKAAQTKDNLASSTVFAAFIKRYPQNEVIAHIMINTDYEKEPEASYKTYQTFSAAAKNGPEGLEIGAKLSHLIKLLPGGTAPPLAGHTPDGKTIDLKSLNKKVILVEFWRASIQIARQNHQTMISDLLPDLAGKSFGIVSVSYDTKRDWWVSAIKDDKMTWPQVNDLKGFDSPNVDNWGTSNIPMYTLVDGQGRIIAHDVAFSNITFTVKNYMEKHL